MTTPLRKDVEQKYTWDTSDVLLNDRSFDEQLSNVVDETKSFHDQFNQTLTTKATINNCLDEYSILLEKITRLGNYVSLNIATDQSDDLYQTEYSLFNKRYGMMMSNLSFVESEILEQDDQLLDEIINDKSTYANFIYWLKQEKPYRLDKNVEQTLAQLSSERSMPYELYDTTKLLDINFPTLEHNGEQIELTYNSFEGTLESHPDTELRRKAYTAFYDTLKQYEHTQAKTYDIHLQMEKNMSDLRGYKNVTEYLLKPQKVDESLYHRQIDTIMEKLSPIIQKYGQLIKKVYNLEKITYQDLKVPLDPDFEPEISIEESKEYVINALKPLGEDYIKMVEDAYNHRWIDFVDNKGKSTGAFCATPYGSHPYVLITWTNLMTEVFVMAHELGHAGHFDLTNKHNNILDTDVSLYFVEAPSTMNEMLMAKSLLKQSDDPRFKRWVIASIISRTYYHNFVTHLLEAAYQREVYRKVESGESVTAEKLNTMKREVLESFFGEDIEIPEHHELTWMRQPHYYMGLYPYTYSAGLTIGTVMANRIEKEGQTAVNDWLKVLKSGDTLTPVELAEKAGIDITTDQPLIETIDYIGSLVDELERLTDEIDNK
ncbi:oligoendopeptidase F [Abyssicoccus albus]|uniref:oligoendopeptidase F n=1 Tax=Abyssicoccus albus TaxID=1817405 RepID=UPI00097E3170|nr:oligoendopeptidase F [Abyssicoccus albus]AQL56217.1 oligoendopeptidase F [Abyssicoccus albus]